MNAGDVGFALGDGGDEVFGGVVGELVHGPVGDDDAELAEVLGEVVEGLGLLDLEAALGELVAEALGKDVGLVAFPATGDNESGFHGLISVGSKVRLTILL